MRNHADEITAGEMDDLTARGMRRRSTRKATIDFLLQTIQRARQSLVVSANTIEVLAEQIESMAKYIDSCRNVEARQADYIEALKNITAEDQKTIEYQSQVIERLERQIANTW